jgi:alkylated DNA nucleotide flippase Atl1
MNNPNLPKVVPVMPHMRKRFGDGSMVVPSPKEVDAFIRTVPKGSIATITQIRDFLAAKYAVDVTCPLTTGIFIHIAAEVAEEDAQAGKKKITPYWRVVKDDGSLNPKFPGGVERQAERLRAEGHRILAASGKRPPRVAFEQTGR